eukprot:6826496-Alexandrium_andersonii.AAC.1
MPLGRPSVPRTARGRQGWTSRARLEAARACPRQSRRPSSSRCRAGPSPAAARARPRQPPVPAL